METACSRIVQNFRLRFAAVCGSHCIIAFVSTAMCLFAGLQTLLSCFLIRASRLFPMCSHHFRSTPPATWHRPSPGLWPNFQDRAQAVQHLFEARIGWRGSNPVSFSGRFAPFVAFSLARSTVTFFSCEGWTFFHISHCLSPYNSGATTSPTHCCMFPLLSSLK